MALTNCKECGSEVSNKAATCPRCGAPVKSQSKPMGCGSWIAIAFVVWVGLIIFGSAKKGYTDYTNRANGKASAPAAPEFDWNDALVMCQHAMKSASKDPEKADIPYVPATEFGDEFMYSWGHSTKMMRMRNGLGLEVATSGSCAVSKTKKSITSMTLNGETII